MTPRTTASPGSREGAGDVTGVWAFPALLAGALVLRIVFFGGLLGWDDVAYVEAARALREGRYLPVSTFDLRYPYTVPLALCQAWLGESERVHALVPLLYGAAHLTLAFLVGALFGGRRVGLLAMGLLALVPLDVIAATDLHADVPVAVFMAAALYAVERSLAAGAPAPWLVAAGAALGLGVLTKETSLAIAVVLVIRIWRSSGPVALARSGWLAAGALAVLGVDAAWLAAATGDPLFRYAGAPRFHTALMAQIEPSRAWMLDYPRMLLDPRADSFGYFAGLFYLALAATVWGLGTRPAVTHRLAVWWATVLVLFNFAPLDLTFTRPLFHHFARTLHPLLIPLVVTAAVWIGGARFPREVLRAAIIGLFAAVALVGTWTTHFDFRRWAAVARQAAPLIERYPAGMPVLADDTNAHLLRFLLRDPRHPVYGLGEWDRGGDGPALVLRDPVFLTVAEHAGHPIPATLRSPPASWSAAAELRRPERPSLRGLVRGWLAGPAPRAAPMEAAVLWQRPRRDR